MNVVRMIKKHNCRVCKFWKVNFMEQKEELLAEGNSCTVTLKPRQIYTVGITTNM